MTRGGSGCRIDHAEMLTAISVLPLERNHQKKKPDGLPSCSVIIIGTLSAAKPRSRIIT
jgi:hypothetical protein